MERKRPFLLSTRGSSKSKMMKTDESASSHSSTIDLAIPGTTFDHVINIDNHTLKSIKISGDIDLTYPFWNDRDDQTLNPPLVNPPLYDNNGYLDIKLSPPLNVVSDKLSLGIDNSLTVTSNLLAVKFSNTSPFTVLNDGISIVTGNGLIINNNSLLVTALESQFEFENKKLKLILDLNGPLVFDNNGLTINVGNGILISNKSISLDVNLNAFKFDGNILNINFNTNSPFLADSNGININIGQGLQITNSKMELQVSPTMFKFIGNQLHLLFNSLSPLKADQDGINIETGYGLQVVNNLLMLNASNSTFDSSNNVLDIKVVSPLIKSVNGISLNTSNECFSISNNMLNVRVVEPISISGNGLKLNINSDSLSASTTLSVNINNSGGLIASNGISIKTPSLSGLKVDNTGIYVSCGNGLQFNSTGDLTLKVENPISLNSSGALTLNTSLGLQISGSNLRVKVGNGVQVDGTGINVKCAAPLNASSGTLNLDYDNSTLGILNGKLTVINNPTYNFVYAEYGSEAFNSFCQVFVPGVAWNQCRVRPFITLAWMGSTVSGILRMKLVSSDFNNATTSTPIKIGMVFDPLQDPSLVQTPVVTSKYPNENSTLDKMRPSNYYINNAINFYDLSGSPWFVDTDRMKWYYTTSFKPDKSGSFANLLESKIYMTSMIHQTRAVLYFMIHILTESSGGSFFDPKDSSKEIYIIDVPFTYSGLKVNASP